MAGHVIGNGRLFEPIEIVRLERPRGADRFLDGPFHVGVRHQRKTLSEMPPHRLHARNVGSEIGPAHLHLDGAEAFAEIVVGLRQQGVDRQVEIDAAGIARHAWIEAAEQAP